jgi:hypothetical protein
MTLSLSREATIIFNQSALTLLVAALFADDTHDAVTTHNLAVAADFFHRCTHFHEIYSSSLSLA